MPIYPSARTVDATEELAGVTVADPYRWLEDGRNKEVRAWQRAQNELTAEAVHALPDYCRVRQLVERHMVPGLATIPTYAGGRWFREYTAPGSSQAGLIVADEPYGEGRVLYDPQYDPSGIPPFLSWFSPSPDGTVLAVGLCHDGSEQNTIRLIDTGSGAILPNAPAQPLMDSYTGGAQWLRDSSGFYFTAFDGAAIDLNQHIMFHDVATGSTTPVDVPWTTRTEYRMVLPSRDGRHLVAVERTFAPIPVAVADLDTPAQPKWRPFVTDLDAYLAGYVIGGRFVGVTDLDAPRGRIVAIELDQPEPEAWTTIVPQSDAVLRGLTTVGELLYVSQSIDTYARVRIFDQNGAVTGAVPLPGKGALGELPFQFLALGQHQTGHPDEYVFAHSTLTSSWGVYRHRPGDTEIEVLRELAVTLANTVVEDLWATSRDGNRIPYHLVRHADTDTTTSQPTLIYAYGGYNLAFLPQFNSAQAAFVAAGGTYVCAHLRGGAEFGRDWWNGGRMSTKQNCYDDLYAVAEQLIGVGRTTPAELAVTGMSNGGLLAGVAMTQRPDLWGAVVTQVPLMDMLGACREPYGRLAVATELADPDDPDEVRRMLTISPYHLVDVDSDYPAVYIDAGDTDPRCPPWHARKFAARLQAAQQGNAPVYLRIWENTGHGFATDMNIAIEQTTDWLTFLLDRLR
ncbi:prolyl oligopeptidase family serine peptidase [Sciscionella marina]|uniref:prolyl oligopeptidase family serine peptidase n=1 Tax=Sciscionella marina TaxID=508770 RepID=UPI000477145A|nr:prolyl oligopeptidase family serine peptidase [Sciscionella marina]